MRGIYFLPRLLLRATTRYRGVLQVFVFLSAGLGYCFLLGSYALSRHHEMAKSRNISIPNPSVQVKVVYGRDQITCWLLAQRQTGSLVKGAALHTHWDIYLCSKRAQWLKLWLFCQRSKYFWKRCNTAWPFRGDLAAITLCQLQLCTMSVSSAGKLSGQYSAWVHEAIKTCNGICMIL